MVDIDATTHAHFVKLLTLEEKKFLNLHKSTCLLGNADISSYQLYTELSLHLHVYYYYPPYLAKKLWEKQYGIRLEYFENQSAARKQIKKAYLPVIIGIRKNKLRKLKKVVNQSVYEKVLYEAVKTKDKRIINYLNMLASDLKLKTILVKIPRENKSWKDYLQDSEIKIQENLENTLILKNSQLSVYEDGKLLRPKNDKGYGQFCANCGIEFKSVVYKDLVHMRKYNNQFVCSKKCYDVLYHKKETSIKITTLS
jgi:hypothetical protein